MTTRTRLTASQRSADILDAAQRLFGERGYHATSVRDIAAAVSLQGGSLYAHMGAKSDLLERVVARMADAFFDALAPVMASGGPADARLREAIRAHVRVVTANLAGATVYQREWLALDVRDRERVLDRRDAYERQWRALLAEHFVEACGMPEPEARRRARVASLILLSAMNAVAGWFRPDGDMGADDVADAYAEMLMNGLQNGTQRKAAAGRR